jgi:di/tricarboxylate transporter
MIMGTGPNAIFAGYVPAAAGVSVSSFAKFAFPLCWIMTFVAWGVIWFFFLRSCRTQSDDELEIVRGIINKQYKDLGPVSFGERIVGSVTCCMALLFIFRKLDASVWGWADIPGLDTKDSKGAYYIRDSVVAITMLFLLFILPVEKPTLNPKDKLPEPILNFKTANSKLAWSVLFILGGGFAMANGIKVSQLSIWIGAKLAFLKQFSDFTIVSFVNGFMAFMTQATSNSSTTSIFLPVLQSIATAAEMNPLKVMAPSVIAVSYAFMLPVSTPPNALCMAYGLNSKDLLKPGAVLVLLGDPIVICWTFMAGSFAFPSMNEECAEWLGRDDDYDTLL